MSKAFIQIGKTIVKKQSVVYVKPADMKSPDGGEQVMVRIAGRQAHLYVPTQQTIEAIERLLNAE